MTLFIVIDTPLMEFLLITLIASVWCLGVWTITEKGKLLSFLKQPILNFIDRKTEYYIGKQEIITTQYGNFQLNCDELQRNIYRERMKAELEIVKKDFNRFKLIMKSLNPVILCPVCMGSVHGFLVFSMFQPLSLWVIPVMVMTSGLNKIWHEKLF